MFLTVVKNKTKYTTAAHHQVRRRLSKSVVKMALAHSSDRWVLHWEK
jgi:hypothetical protein